MFDAYAVPQSQQQFIGESYPVQSTHTGTCLTGKSEPGMQSSPNGGAVSCQARALNVTSQYSTQNNKCLKKKKGTLYHGYIILCDNSREITCAELPWPAGWLCKKAIGAWCRHYCNYINNWNPWPDHCTSQCMNSPTGHCIDCCNANCKSHGSLAKCYNMCDFR